MTPQSMIEPPVRLSRSSGAGFGCPAEFETIDSVRLIPLAA